MIPAATCVCEIQLDQNLFTVHFYFKVVRLYCVLNSQIPKRYFNMYVYLQFKSDFNNTVGFSLIICNFQRQESY